MESQTVERVFGGLIYLLGASSKEDFFFRLEAFLREVFGPAPFSFLLAGPRGASLKLAFSNHPLLPPQKGEPPGARCPALGTLTSRNPEYRPAAGEEPARLVVGSQALPVFQARLIGDGVSRGECLAFHLPTADCPPEDETFGLWEMACDHIALAYYRAEDQDQLLKKLDLCEAKLAAIGGLGELIGNLDLDVLLAKLMELSLFIASAQVGSVVLSGPGGLESRVEWGLPLWVLEGLGLRGGGSVLDRVLSTGQPELIADFLDPERCQGAPELRVESCLCVPLLSKGKVLGAINLINSSGESGFSQADRESILTLSGLASIAIENAILHREAIEKERIAAGLRIACGIQQRMYPKERPLIPGYQVAWLNESCEETGGDYFDFVPIDEESLAVAIGDVSGHGIGAALLMAAGRANLRALLSVRQGIREAMAALDELLERDMEAGQFMTLFLGRLDHRRHLLGYVNAGHDRPLIFRRRSGQVEELASTGPPLGILGAAAGHREAEPVAIEEGDVLLLSTDGVWEEANPDRQRFGKKRLIEVLAREARQPPEAILRAIHQETSAFQRNAPRADDFTMVALKRV